MSLKTREDLLQVTSSLAAKLPQSCLVTCKHTTKNPWGRRYSYTQYFIPVDVALQSPSASLRRRAREAAKRLLRV